jgi:catalase
MGNEHEYAQVSYGEEPVRRGAGGETHQTPSPALSIVANGPDSFAGRKLGVLVSDGVDAGLIRSVREAAHKHGVAVELVAPVVGGVTAGDGSVVGADQKITCAQLRYWPRESTFS